MNKKTKVKLAPNFKKTVDALKKLLNIGLKQLNLEFQFFS